MFTINLKNLGLLLKEAAKFGVNVVIPVEQMHEDIDGDVFLVISFQTEDPNLHSRIWAEYKAVKGE